MCKIDTCAFIKALDYALNGQSFLVRRLKRDQLVMSTVSFYLIRNSAMLEMR